ncbi:MAG: four helix bundle protein [Oscillospiraceae bacterium]|nr:four helix bundle protein [Oscillospiraceae bacterium]
MDNEFQTGSAVADKSFEFAVRIVNLSKYLRYRKKEFVLSKQLLRSGTSIGANVSEGRRAQSKADFLAKMNIALKEANETHYWLRLLYRTDYLTKSEFQSIESDVDELLRILTAICKTATERRG